MSTLDKQKDQRPTSPWGQMMLFLSVLACTTLGFLNAAPVWSVAIMAIVMTLLGASEDRALSTRFNRLGGAKVLSLALAQSVLSNLVFAAIAFVVGRVVASLVGGFL